jgi:hypothetical protein
VLHKGLVSIRSQVPDLEPESLRSLAVENMLPDVNVNVSQNINGVSKGHYHALSLLKGLDLVGLLWTSGQQA